MSKHQNTGDCQRCDSIFDRYLGFDPRLRSWFKEFQTRHPEAHISCAGRGRDDQEELFIRKATRAHFGKSAHNYNCAIDVFELQGDLANIYEEDWFIKVLAPEIPDWIEWYGASGASFPELPHLEVKNWHQLFTRLVG